MLLRFLCSSCDEQSKQINEDVRHKKQSLLQCYTHSPSCIYAWVRRKYSYFETTTRMDILTNETASMKTIPFRRQRTKYIKSFVSPHDLLRKKNVLRRFQSIHLRPQVMRSYRDLLTDTTKIIQHGIPLSMELVTATYMPHMKFILLLPSSIRRWFRWHTKHAIGPNVGTLFM